VHEMAITQSVIETISERMGDAPVQRVCLEIGTLSGVVADSVRFCFEVLAMGTTLEGRRWRLFNLPGRPAAGTAT
jgi:hydrogenase nickel incorporation protein HypA/HybF